MEKLLSQKIRESSNQSQMLYVFNNTALLFTQFYGLFKFSPLLIDFINKTKMIGFMKYFMDESSVLEIEQFETILDNFFFFFITEQSHNPMFHDVLKTASEEGPFFGRLRGYINEGFKFG